MLRELLHHRDLLWLLVVREVRVRYARTVLGAAWAVFPPLVLMAVFTFLNLGRMVDPASPYAAVDYPLFAYCGLLPWQHFSGSLSAAAPSLVNSRDILRKSAFPREVIPMARVLATILDLAIGSLVLVVLMVVYDVPLRPTLVVLPAVFLLQILFTTGLALLLSAGNLFYRDVGYLLQFAILFGMFITEVIYPIPVKSGFIGTLLAWNPMSSYLDTYRRAVLLGEWPGASLLPGLVGGVLAFVIGVIVFRRAAPRFVEEA